MSSECFVGREDAVKRLRDLILGEGGAGKLSIQSVEGPGGIGKTSLLNHALSGVDLTGRRYLTLRVEGDLTASTMARSVARMVDSASARAIDGRAPRFYFPTVDRVLKAMDAIRSEIEAEFKSKYPDDEDSLQILLQLVDRAFELGKTVGDAVPYLKAVVDLKKLDHAYTIAKDMMPLLRSLSKDGGKFVEKLGLFSENRSLRNAIKENACLPLSEALRSDLAAILSGYQKKDLMKAKQRKVQGVDRLLLIIDDYEMQQAHLGEFLVGHFLPALRNADFESTVIVLCRDRLEATHPSWDQQFKPHMRKRIDLSPLSRTEMDTLIESLGVTSEAEKVRAWDDTQGYPYYVQLWVEEMTEGGAGALMLKQFHDRTTRWMTSKEREWLLYTLFLNQVNMSTLRHMLPAEQDAKEAFDWFTREGSVRDPSGKSFRVREYIRSRLADYLKVTDPDRFQELQRKGQVAEWAGGVGSMEQVRGLGADHSLIQT